LGRRIDIEDLSVNYFTTITELSARTRSRSIKHEQVLALFSLNHDFLTVLNNDTLIALEDTLTAQVVNWLAIAEDVVSVVHQLFV